MSLLTPKGKREGDFSPKQTSPKSLFWMDTLTAEGEAGRAGGRRVLHVTFPSAVRTQTLPPLASCSSSVPSPCSTPTASRSSAGNRTPVRRFAAGAPVQTSGSQRVPTSHGAAVPNTYCHPYCQLPGASAEHYTYGQVLLRPGHPAWGSPGPCSPRIAEHAPDFLRLGIQSDLQDRRRLQKVGFCSLVSVEGERLHGANTLHRAVICWGGDAASGVLGGTRGGSGGMRTGTATKLPRLPRRAPCSRWIKARLLIALVAARRAPRGAVSAGRGVRDTLPCLFVLL